MLFTLAKSGKSDKAGEMYRSCMELFEKARMAVENYNLAAVSWDRRGPSGQSGGRESLEEFLRRIEHISSGYDVDISSISRNVSPEFALEHQI